jgi:glycosyltransferase involved in cell wall biosynthesis
MQYYLDIPSSKEIHVYYTPERYFENTLLCNDSEILNQYGLEKKKFFLLSSGCRWAKNNAIVLFVLDKMFSNKKYADYLKDFKVVLLGVDGTYLHYYKRKISNIDRFVFDYYVDDATMETLYRNAHLFVFPSIIEGFGLPPVEAMKYGTVSACSTSMSIPEVCGDAVIYFEPHSEDSITMAILRSFNERYMELKKIKANERLRELSEIRSSDLNQLIDLILTF